MPAAVLAVAAALLAGATAPPLPTVERPVVRVDRVVLVDRRAGTVRRSDRSIAVQDELKRPTGAACRPIVAARGLRAVALAVVPWREQVPLYEVRGTLTRTANGTRARLDVPAPAILPLVAAAVAPTPAVALRVAVRALVDRICAAHRDAVAGAQAAYLQDALGPLAGERLVGAWIVRDERARAVSVGVSVVAPTSAERAVVDGLGGLPAELLAATHTLPQLMALGQEIAPALGIAPVDMLLDVQHDGLIARFPWVRYLALTPEERAALEAEGTRRGVRLTIQGAGLLPPVPGFPVWQRGTATCPRTGAGMRRRTGLRRPNPPKEHFVPEGTVRAVVCLYTRAAPRTPGSDRNGTALVASGAYPAAGLADLVARLEALPRYDGGTVYCTDDGRGDALDGMILVSADGGTYPVALETRALNPGENPACGGAVAPGGSRVLGDDYSLTRLLFAALGRRAPV